MPLLMCLYVPGGEELDGLGESKGDETRNQRIISEYPRRWWIIHSPCCGCVLNQRSIWSRQFIHRLYYVSNMSENFSFSLICREIQCKEAERESTEERGMVVLLSLTNCLWHHLSLSLSLGYIKWVNNEYASADWRMSRICPWLANNTTLLTLLFSFPCFWPQFVFFICLYPQSWQSNYTS